MDEQTSDKMQMALVIITFLAFAVALGFAYAEWAELDDPEYRVEQNVFP